MRGDLRHRALRPEPDLSVYADNRIALLGEPVRQLRVNIAPPAAVARQEENECVRGFTETSTVPWASGRGNASARAPEIINDKTNAPAAHRQNNRRLLGLSLMSVQTVWGRNSSGSILVELRLKGGGA